MLWMTICCWLSALALMSAYGQEQNSASKSELSRADYYVGKLEAEARKHGDKSFKLGHESKEAIKRVTELGARYPADPQVQKLLQRVKAAVPWHFQETDKPAVPDKTVDPPEKTSDAAADNSKVPPNDVSRADYFLRKLEEKVRKSRGAAFPLRYEEEEALKRIKKLKEQYPDDAKVEEMFARARRALLASKGEVVQIGQEMLAFRENEQRLKKVFAAEADQAWQLLRDNTLASPTTLRQPFPSPSHRDVGVEEMAKRHVILEEFIYPANEFSDLGRQFVAVGSGTRGYYYVELSNRAWLGAYEAIRRYRRLVNRDLPPDTKWTVLGRVIGLELMVPQAGKEKNASVAWGWSVEIVAIYIPGCTLAVADAQHPEGGHFAGEERLQEIKAPMYTVTSVPADVTPEKLIEIFSFAIREKNYDLYLDCIDPERRKTNKALSLCSYHWEWHQERFAKFYVHIVVEPATIRVIKGFDADNELESFFLSEQDKANIASSSEPVVEQAQVTTRAYDERGRQYGSPKPFFLKRINKGRWYITSYAQPF